ncbi:MAG: hypothetical protein ACRC68_06715 [Clostridium sp.]
MQRNYSEEIRALKLDSGFFKMSSSVFEKVITFVSAFATIVPWFLLKDTKNKVITSAAIIIFYLICFLIKSLSNIKKYDLLLNNIVTENTKQMSDLVFENNKLNQKVSAISNTSDKNKIKFIAHRKAFDFLDKSIERILPFINDQIVINEISVFQKDVHRELKRDLADKEDN